MPDNAANRIHHVDRDLTYAYVSDSRIGDTRTVFVRLVPRGVARPANTYQVEDCSVDLDDDGQVIGINLFWNE